MFTIKAILMSILPFYRIDFPLDYFPQDVAYVEYQHGRDSAERMLNEKELHAFKKLLLENREGWRYDLTTYAPGKIFKSSGIKINCLDGGEIVVNYMNNDNASTQISKKSAGPCPVIALAKETQA